MRLIKAELRNFCQHRSTEVEFAPNLNAILGPNGSGKTNLLNGLYYALTGDMRGFGVKDDNVCQLAPKDEPSYVKLKFEHGGVKAEIQRGLRNSGSMLSIQGQKDIKKPSDINTKMEEILGLPKRILSDFIFIEQNKISAFLSMKSADRAVALQRLFGTHYCEKAWNTIGEHMKRVVVPSPRVDVEAVNERIAATRAKMVKLQSDLNTCPISDDWDLRIDPDFLLKDKWDKRQEIAQEIEKLNEQLNIAARSLQISEQSLADYSQEVNKILEEMPTPAELEEASKTVNQWMMYNKMASSRNQLELELTELEQEVNTHPKPGPPPEDYLQGDDLITYYGATKDKEIELHNLKAFIDTIDIASGTASCPTCNTGFPATDIEQRRAHMDELATEIQQRKQRMHRSREHADAVRAYKLWAMDYKKRAVKVTERMNGLSDFMHEPQASIEAADELLKKSERLKQQHKALLPKLQIAESGAVNHRARVDMLKEAIQTKTELYTQFEIPNGNINQLIQAANRRLDVKEKAYKERIRINAECQSLSRLLESDERLAMEASRVLVKATRYRDWLSVLDGARSVLHKEALPKLISQKYLTALEEEINKILSELSAPFRIRTGDDLGFIAEFANGGVHRAERLSTGQQCVLSIAMRIVVNATFAGDTGLLSLDEPTEGLDADNLQGLEIALKRLQSLSQDRGLQCLLVTHEDALEPMFDNVITLSAPV